MRTLGVESSYPTATMTTERTVDPVERANALSVGRIRAIDFIRGVAVTLMILSHGVKGLLTFEQMPAWGIVPIHLITKFSSSLFIITFGMALAIAYVPHADRPGWHDRRRKLLVRGLVVLFWYKVLTVVEMAHLYSREDIIKTLMYQAFPVYVEILGFYALALLWVPFVLPAWKKLAAVGKWILPIAILGLWKLLYDHFDFFGSEVLRAMIVEDPKHYTWGQLARAPLIFLGLLMGDWVKRVYWSPGLRARLSSALIGVGVVLFAGFMWFSRPNVYEALVSVAKNEGKHPPELAFMLFSLGGAFAIVGVTLMAGEILASILRPITIIGKDALRSFVFHICVIFVFYRYLFDYWRSISYLHALGLAALLIVLTALWIKITDSIREVS